MRLPYRLPWMFAFLIAFCCGSVSAQETQTNSTAATGAAPAVGTIITYAGNGYGAGSAGGGYSGDGGPATSAELWWPEGIAFDAAGNLYIADNFNLRIRKVDAATGTITTAAGNGLFFCTGSTPQNYCGDGGPATSASLGFPQAVAFDSSGNLYIAGIDGLVRKVDAKSGNISTYAGAFNCQGGVCTPAKGDTGDGGPATSAELANPVSLAVDASNNLYIADGQANVVRMVSAATGVITTVAGGGSGCAQQTDTMGDGCPATQAQFATPTAIALDQTGDLYIADFHTLDSATFIRRVDAKTGIITLFAGGTPCSQAIDSYGDGCSALNYDFASGNSTVAGLAFDTAGNLYVSDGDEASIHVINAKTTIVSDVAGDFKPGFAGTGGPAISAELDGPWGIAFDSSGNLYFADIYNNVIREVVESTTPVTPAPTFSPSAGTYNSTQMVSISDSLNSATIYYTTDGSTPTTSSTQYTGTIDVAQTTTINAIAAASGYTNSAVASATYTIATASPAATPTFSPAAGTYTSAQTVAISDTTAGATLYYTTDGSAPTASSTKYSAPITVSQTTTISAIAIATGFANSAVGTATYTITLPQAAAPAFSPAAGTYTTAQTVTLTDSTPGATIYYTTDGSNPTTSSTKYTSPIAISQTSTINAVATASAFTTSVVASATYTINQPAPDFTVSLSPTTLSVSGGKSGTTTVSITPQNGFSSAVSFACSGQPTDATCTFSPATVTPSGAVATTTLTIATTTADASFRAGRTPFGPAGATLALALCCLGLRRRRTLQRYLMLAVCLAGIGWLGGCGGGSGSSTNNPPPPQSKTYNVTVTATSGSLSHTANITLTVTQ